MLSMTKYPQSYIDDCRAKVTAQVTAYKKATSGMSDGAGAAFAPLFFNNLVLLLDYFFVHRARTLELKDGNPLNEVRVICNSLLLNGGAMTADKTIKMKPATSVLGYEVGATIALDETAFASLSKAFFAEIESKFT